MRFPRLEAILGAQVHELTETHLQRLVDGAVAEAVDLEFKRDHYETNERGKKELAKDIAAMANASGGVIIIGIRETNGVASALAPLPVSDAEELRMHQTIASTCAPLPDFRIHAVSNGYYVIAVPRSSWAPHAVVVNDALRYPLRLASGTHVLSESDVANAYRNRFRGAADQAARVTEVRLEGEQAVLPYAPLALLSCAFVPNLPGRMTIDRQAVYDFRSFGQARRIPMPQSTIGNVAPWPLAGFRRVIVHLGMNDDGRPSAGTVQLHEDGSSYFGLFAGSPGQPMNPIQDEDLVADVVTIVGEAAAHAIERCGTGGDSVAEITIASAHAVSLGDCGRSHSFHRDDPTRVMNGQVPVGRHTINFDAIAGSRLEQVLAARLLLNDVFQALGEPECRQISADGRFNFNYYRHSVESRMQMLDQAIASDS